MNKITLHLIRNKRNYILGFSMFAWFVLLLLIATRNGAPYDNIAINFNGLTIAWYAIFILTGILFAAVLAMEEADLIGIKRDDIYDGLLYAVPLAIIGARLYYVLFDPNGSYESFLDVINIPNGGLAIHGAVITTLVFVYVFTKLKKISIWKIFDLLAPGFLIGQILGRWGNFFNQEANGSATTRDFLSKTLHLPNFIVDNMYFYDYNVGETAYFHPTFLYEGTWNMIGFITLLVLRRTKWIKSGDLIGVYLIWYGFGRSLIENFLRTDPLMIVGTDIKVNVLNSVLMIVIGLLYLVLKRVFFKDLPYYKDILKKREEKA